MKDIRNFLEETQNLRSAKYTCVYLADHEINERDAILLEKNGCAIETKYVSSILLANSIGIAKDMIYFDMAGKTPKEAASVFGKCSYIISSINEIDILNSIVEELNGPGHMETIGIRIAPVEDIFDSVSSIPATKISDLAASLRKADYIAVRGIFIYPGQLKYSSKNSLQDCFSLIKEIRSSLPCSLSYFCMESLIETLGSRSEFLRHDLEIVRSLNDTSLYASFLLN